MRQKNKCGHQGNMDRSVLIPIWRQSTDNGTAEKGQKNKLDVAEMWMPRWLCGAIYFISRYESKWLDGNWDGEV